MVDKVEVQQEETTSEKPVEETKVEETKQENVETTDKSEQQQPEKILGKFNNQEDLIKAYQELEAKNTKQAQETKKEEGLEIKQDTKAEEVVESAGLDMASLQKEYDDNGELSNDSLNKLAQVGISKDIVDGYIQGQNAVAQQLETEIKGIVGGQENYTSMMSWAKENMSPDQINAYNRIVNGRDVDAIKVAVAGLNAQMKTDQGEPELISGRQSNTVATYESWAQVTEAMKDPRYGKDPAYQAEVQQKISNSNL
tara:strand:- start:972 stop:1736 length:765 start_codon:yes stop_codon:yes gene_type:complete